MSAKNFYQARLLLCRHGEATGNLKHAFLGSRDDALTQQGHKQAQDLARLLADEAIDVIYTSPLQRASQTAAALGTLLNLPVTTEALLTEQDFGSWEGLNFAEVRKQFPESFATWLDDANNHGPPGGENLNQVVARVSRFYQQLKLADDRTYVLVAHGGCLQALLCHIFGIPTRAIWPFRLANGSVTEVQFSRGQASMTRLSVL